MSMELVWINTERNVRRTFSGRSGYNVQQITGFSLPELDHFAARSPRQHGAIYQDTFFRPRECSIELAVLGCDAAEFEAKHRDLVQILNPLEDGQLLVLTSDDQRYTLNARPSAAIAVTRPNSRGGFMLLQLTADDPFFYGSVVTVPFTTVTESLLTIPFTIPATITGGASIVFSVTNSGHLPVYPVITLSVGLYAALTVTNVTTGESLRVEAVTGLLTTTTVDMGEKTVTRSGGGDPTVSLLADTSGVFWALNPGTTQVKIQTAEPTPRSGTVAFTAKYLAVV